MSKLRKLLGDRIIKEEKIFNSRGEWKSTAYTVKCPVEGCSNTCKISKIHEVLTRKCKKHCLIDNNDRTKWKPAVSRKNLTCKKCLVGKVSTPDAPCHRCKSDMLKKRPYERLYNQAKRVSSRTRADGSIIEWLLSYEELVALCEIDNCHYCGQPLNRAKYKSDQGSTSLLLDRKNSEASYTIDNCVPCCPKCNDTKGRFISYEEMMLLMNFRKSRNLPNSN